MCVKHWTGAYASLRPNQAPTRSVSADFSRALLSSLGNTCPGGPGRNFLNSLHGLPERSFFPARIAYAVPAWYKEETPPRVLSEYIENNNSVHVARRDFTQIARSPQAVAPSLSPDAEIHANIEEDAATSPASVSNPPDKPSWTRHVQ